jgi:hypothetical protein
VLNGYKRTIISLIVHLAPPRRQRVGLQGDGQQPAQLGLGLLAGP